MTLATDGMPLKRIYYSKLVNLSFLNGLLERDSNVVEEANRNSKEAYLIRENV